MSEAIFTFRVDETLKSEFTTAAKSRDRTGAQLLRNVMRDFVRQQEEAVEHDVWFAAKRAALFLEQASLPLRAPFRLLAQKIDRFRGGFGRQ